MRVRSRAVVWLGWGALLGAGLLLAQSCSSGRTHGLQEASVPPSAPPALELWVDAAAPEGGDGSTARPLRRLEDALLANSPNRRVHLAPGLYLGPFTAVDGTQLVGGSAAVLTAPAGVTVLVAKGTVSLERLLIQGGTLGLRSSGALRLVQVHFSGQRLGALLVAEGATLSATDSVFEASVSEGVGMGLEPGARARLSGCTFEGPWRHGIEAHAPAALVVASTGFRGAVTALHLRGGSAELSDVTISEGRGPGLYVAGGRLLLHRVQVSGHEYGLLTGSGAVVEAEDLSSTRADRAGVAVVRAQAQFRRLSITSAGSFGGLQCVGSKVRVEGLRVEGVAGVGVSQRDGTLELEDALVTGTRDPDGSGGEGLALRGGSATLHNLTVRQTAGACLLAAEGADVGLSKGTLERCHTAGLVAETSAHLTATNVTVVSSEGPGAVAAADASLVLSSFQATSTEGLVWAECAGGAQVRAWQVGGLPALPCVQPLSRPPLLPP
ncbi:MAG: hypothetical protein ACLQIH_00230 [Myxococcaceae bacterium]